MNTQASEKQSKVRAALHELYGDDEKTLIVLNKRGTIISVGFGDLGDKMGHQIPNTKLPIVLTDLFPPKTWLDSPDFRKCIAQGWLELISQETADEITTDFEARQKRLRQLAGNDDRRGGSGNYRADPLNDVVPGSTPMVLDEDTATLVPADQDPTARKQMEYLAEFGDPGEQETARRQLGITGIANRGRQGEDREQHQAASETQPGVESSDGALNPKALQIVEGLRKKTIQAADALMDLDNLSDQFSEDDLQYVIANTGKFPGIRQWANETLSGRDE